MRAWKFGDNIDTDAIIPGRFLTIYDEKELARHAFEGTRDDFAKLAVKFDDKEHIGFENYFKKYNDAKFVVEFFTAMPKELKKRYDVEPDVKSIAEPVFEKVLVGEIAKGSVIELLADYGKTGRLDFAKFKGVSAGDLESEIKQIVEKNKGAPIGALMGMIMAKFRGKADGKKIFEKTQKLVLMK